jgi:hypothetical protein
MTPAWAASPAPDQQIDRVYSPNYKLTPPCRLLRSWVPAAAPIGTGDDLHEVTVWIFEIDTPASIVMVDFLLFRLCGVGPISQPAFAYSPEYLVELCFTDQEGVVLRGDLFLSVNKIDVCVIIGPNHLKRPHWMGPGKPNIPARKVADARLSREETIV